MRLMAMNSSHARSMALFALAHLVRVFGFRGDVADVATSGT